MCKGQLTGWPWSHWWLSSGPFMPSARQRSCAQLSTLNGTACVCMCVCVRAHTHTSVWYRYTGLAHPCQYHQGNEQIAPQLDTLISAPLPSLTVGHELLRAVELVVAVDMGTLGGHAEASTMRLIGAPYCVHFQQFRERMHGMPPERTVQAPLIFRPPFTAHGFVGGSRSTL